MSARAWEKVAIRTSPLSSIPFISRMNESSHPTLVYPFPCSGPPTEFLDVVRSHGQRFSGPSQSPDVCGGVRRGMEGEEVPEGLVDGEHAKAFPSELGPEGAMELISGEARSHEMAIVHQHVADPCVHQILGQVRFPDALRQPKALGLHPETTAKGLLHPPYLVQPVFLEERGKNGFVVPGEEQLELSVGHQPPYQVEVGRAVCLQPVQKGPREVQGQREKIALFRSDQKGFVHIPEVFFKDMAEIPHGLVGVQTEREIDWILHRVAHQAGVNPRGSRRRASLSATSGDASERSLKKIVWASKGMGSPSRM